MTPSIGEGANHALESAVELVHTLAHNFYSTEWRARVGIPDAGLEVSVDELSDVFTYFGEMRPSQVRRGLVLSALASRHGYAAQDDLNESILPPIQRHRSLKQRGAHPAELPFALQQQRPPTLMSESQPQRSAFGMLTLAQRVVTDAAPLAAALQLRTDLIAAEVEISDRALLQDAQYYSYAGDRGRNAPHACNAAPMSQGGVHVSRTVGSNLGNIEARSFEAPEALNGWVEEWQRQIQTWWLATPFRDGLRSCMGSLSLLLTSNMRRFISASWDAALVVPPSPPSLVQDKACEWIGSSEFQLKLPHFPDMPRGHFEGGAGIVVPLPRLLPDAHWLQVVDMPTGEALVADERNGAGPTTRANSLLAISMGASGVMLTVIVVAMHGLSQRRKGRLDLARLQAGDKSQQARVVAEG